MHIYKETYLFFCISDYVEEELVVFIILTLPSDPYLPWIRNCTDEWKDHFGVWVIAMTLKIICKLVFFVMII